MSVLHNTIAPAGSVHISSSLLRSPCLIRCLFFCFSPRIVHVVSFNSSPSSVQTMFLNKCMVVGSLLVMAAQTATAVQCNTITTSSTPNLATLCASPTYTGVLELPDNQNCANSPCSGADAATCCVAAVSVCPLFHTANVDYSGADYDGAGTAAGASYAFSCNPGYQPTGVATCANDGRAWAIPQPTCEKTNGDNGPPPCVAHCNWDNDNCPQDCDTSSCPARKN